MRGSLVANNSLVIRTNIPEVIRESGASTWNEITGKPFSTVDTENGLAIYDNTLMIDTLDKIATIDFVNSKVPDAPTADGTYTLQVAVLNGEPTYSWQPTTLL